MNFSVLAVILPFLAAPFLGFLGTPAQGAIANLALNAVVFILTLAVFFSPGTGLIHADQLGMIFGALTAFVSLTTAITNIAFVRRGK